MQKLTPRPRRRRRAWKPEPAAAERPATAAPEHCETRVDGYRLCWAASGTGPPVVLLHGLCGSQRWWSANIPALERDFRVLALDLPGFGRSRRLGRIPPLPAMADLVAAWMQREGAAPAHLVGHSMGGHLAMHLAARHPDRVQRLVLTDAAGLYRPLALAPLTRWAVGLASPRSWGVPSFFPVIWRDALRAGPLTAARALHGILSDDVTPLLQRITAPTLILWGEKDALIPVEYALRLREAIPGSRLHVIPGAYHNPMVDRPEEFNGMVRAFLRGDEVGA